MCSRTIKPAGPILLGRYYFQERSPVAATEIPVSLKNALIATEDVRFYKHHGVDTKSLFRVLFKTLLFQEESSGGGSTLTQQLAKNLYPRKQHRFLSMPINKIREFMIAGNINAALHQILPETEQPRVGFFKRCDKFVSAVA